MPNKLRTLLETRRFSVVEETVTKPGGETASLQYIKHPGSVAILPLLDDGRVCLIHSRRLTVDKTLLEIPAGTREPNENPVETARRELAEETGYRAAKFEPLAEFYPSPGITDERMWVYLATGLTPGNHAREPNEEIENHVVPFEMAMELLERGVIEDGKSIIALLAYQRQRTAK